MAPARGSIMRNIVPWLSIQSRSKGKFCRQIERVLVRQRILPSGDSAIRASASLSVPGAIVV
jgi:hypothetical protein